MKYLLSAVLLWSITTVSLFAKSPILHSKVKSVDVKQSKGTLQEINYQGWLGDASDTNEVTDVLDMNFRLYDAETEGALLWSETQSAVNIDKGIFNVLLGSTTPIPSNIFTGDPLWLETQVENDTLTPRKKLVSVGYAIKSKEAEHSIHSDTANYAFAANVLIDSVIYADTAGYASSGAPDNDWIVSDSNLSVQDTSLIVGIGTANPPTHSRLYVAANGAFYGIYGLGSDGKEAGVFGLANKANYGILGLGSTGKTAGVRGEANGASYGVYGLGSAGKQASVKGLANGAQFGVLGTGSAGGDAGVHGDAHGANYGVYGRGSTGKTAGVRGDANGASYAGYFYGDMHIEGEVTMKKVVRYYSIPACAFSPSSGNYNVTRRDNWLSTNTAGYTNWYAPVNLPDGAVVTELSCRLADSDASNNVTVTLYSCSNVGSVVYMGDCSTTGSTGLQTITDVSISNATIDNENYPYFVALILSSGTSQHEILRVRIKYEITKPLP